MIILSVAFRDHSDFRAEPDDYADFLEYRLDYCHNLSAVDWSIFTEKHILTLREYHEGGSKAINPEAKIAFLKEIVLQTPALIDCEYIFLQQHPELSIPPERLILSYHAFQDNIEPIAAFLHTSRMAKYYKLAVAVSGINELLNITKQHTDAAKSNKIILIPLSPASPSLRLYYRFYSIATYVYRDIPLADNQISLSLAKLCRIKTLHQKKTIYGIIGKEQVAASLSVKVYNGWFNSHGARKVFLPVIAASWDDAIEQIDYLKTQTKVKGFAITMPYKQSLMSRLPDVQNPVNTWMPATGFTTSTDASALEEILIDLWLNPLCKILIFGTGAMAKIALDVLISLEMKNIYQMNRQFELRKYQKNKWVSVAATSLKSVNLLINCTPYGTNETDDPDLLPEFAGLIDLAYTDMETTLVQKAKQTTAKLCIDGKAFWKTQAVYQVKIFGWGLDFQEYVSGFD